VHPKELLVAVDPPGHGVEPLVKHRGQGVLDAIDPKVEVEEEADGAG
jgi:hypothetical protein